MRILIIDTSGSLASVAIVSEEKLISEIVLSADRTLSARLIPEISQMLDKAGLTTADMDLFVSTTGPGSFTGVRAGVATVQGLALATDKPCLGVSTLELLAAGLPYCLHPVCPMFDARKNEVYTSLFSNDTGIVTRLTEDCVMPPKYYLEKLDELTGDRVVFVGDGAIRYRDLICSHMGNRALFPPFAHNAIRAANAATIAVERYKAGMAVDPSKLLPVYLRASEAEYAKMNRQKANSN